MNKPFPPTMFCKEFSLSPVHCLLCLAISSRICSINLHLQTMDFPNSFDVEYCYLSSITNQLCSTPDRTVQPKSVCDQFYCQGLSLFRATSIMAKNLLYFRSNTSLLPPVPIPTAVPSFLFSMVPIVTSTVSPGPRFIVVNNPPPGLSC